MSKKPRSRRNKLQAYTTPKYKALVERDKANGTSVSKTINKDLRLYYAKTNSKISA